MQSTHALESIPDDELLRRLAELLGQSRRTEADLVAHVGEVDARRLYAREASPSMFTYCTEVLHLSGAEAYLRIAAARASREHPVLLEMLADGRLHLTAIAKLAPHLTLENREALLSRAVHRSKREIEELVAELAPRPDAPAVMRKLPERRVVEPAPARRGGPDGATPGLGLRPDGVAAAGLELRLDAVAAAEPELRLDAVAGLPVSVRPRPAAVEPLAPARYTVQFTASAELRDKLERLQALMRSSVPDGDLAAIIEQAVSEKLERLEARSFARSKAPRTGLPARGASGCAVSSSAGRDPLAAGRPSRAAGGDSAARGKSSPAPASGSPAPDSGSPAAASGSPAPGSASPAPGNGSPPGAHGPRSSHPTSPPTRHIPAAVRRAVYERDGGRCRYVDAQGRRCTARDRLEFHHRRPFGHGGDHSVDGISLLCRAHNQYLAEVDYGCRAMALHRRRPVVPLPHARPPAP